MVVWDDGKKSFNLVFLVEVIIICDYSMKKKGNIYFLESYCHELIRDPCRKFKFKILIFVALFGNALRPHQYSKNQHIRTYVFSCSPGSCLTNALRKSRVLGS